MINVVDADVIVALTSSDIPLSCEKKCLDSNNLSSVEKLFPLKYSALTSFDFFVL